MVDDRDGEVVELKDIEGRRRGLFLLGLRGRRSDLREIFHPLPVGAAGDDIGRA